jgi:hypothetical protein
VAFGTASGNAFVLSLDNLQPIATRSFASPIVALSVLPFPSSLQARVAFFPETLFENTRLLSAVKFINKIPPSPVEPTNEEILVALCEDKTLRIVSNQKPPITVRLPVSNLVRSSPVIAELENRGELAIVFTADDKIFCLQPTRLSDFKLSDFNKLTKADCIKPNRCRC